MTCQATGIFLICLFGCIVRAQTQNNEKVFNIQKYGAIGDGKTDNSKVITNAWSEACEFDGSSVVVIPQGTFMAFQLCFTGPCKGPIEFQLVGTLKASADPESHSLNYWISFQNVNNLTLSGKGTIDGQGCSAWKLNECKTNPQCKQLATSLELHNVNNSNIHDITFLNSKQFHMKIVQCSNVNLDNITITAPSDSPNTDGIHIGLSNNIQISNSIIGTGDDCISMGPGLNEINITNIICGPGHGISIGSLGTDPNEDGVSGITVSNCIFKNTSNGARIKTKATSTKSIVSNITFEHIKMNCVDNPIIIDQLYCPNAKCDPQDNSQIQIENVKFNDIKGTSNKEMAINLQCSKTVPCKHIELKAIKITKSDGGATRSTCVNVDSVNGGKLNPPYCENVL